MRFSNSANEAAVLSAFLLPLLAGAYDCNHIRINEVPFDLSKLAGARSVIHSVDRGASYLNATYTLDICRPLGKAKSVPSKDQCPNGTRLCAIERGINKETGVDSIEEVFPVAGELGDHGGKAMDAKWERLKDSTSNADSEKEGLRVEMNGGFKKDDEGKKRPQKAIIEFICDRTKDGLENLPSPEDQYDEVKDKREEKEGEKEGEDDSKSPSLSFFKWDHVSDSDILRLEWRTKYACEESKEEQDKEKAKGWGWFTWFIIIAFLSTAAYLIFGSWLNYNKYGARGWDLLPHSDTIRDIPYLMKDWIRRVLNTVQGGGSRGGYAAV